MILTEEEAKTRRCQESFGPLFMTPEGGEHHIPRYATSATAAPSGLMANVASPGFGHNMPTIASPGYCIGSKCMAWRWRVTEGAAWDDKPVGYCGKAGPA